MTTSVPRCTHRGIQIRIQKKKKKKRKRYGPPRNRVRQFLFKVMHQPHMIENVWSGIQGYETRAICETCNAIESMEHILLECRSVATRTIWKKAKGTWPHGRQAWPDISISTILRVGCLNLPQDRPPRADHLFWTLRCERAIRQEQHTRREIIGRWSEAINHRITIDKITASKIKGDPRFTNLVEAIWSKVTQ